MLVTADTSHADRSWLKDCTLQNIPCMSVTADTSHADRSWLKDSASLNIKLISVTADTSHDPIGPFGLAGQMPAGDSLMHASIASWSSVLLWGANTAVTATTNAFGVGALTAMIHTRVGTRSALYNIAFIYHVTVAYQGKKLIK